MNLEFNNSQNTDDSSIESSLNDDLHSHEEHYIIEAFENNNGVRCCIANELGISERTLRYKLLRFREEGVAIPEKVGKKSA